MSDTRWLEKRGPGYYAIQAVPRPLWEVVGKRRLVKSLKTRDLRVAIARRFAALAEFAGLIAQAQRKAGPDPLTEAGLAWRDTLNGKYGDDLDTAEMVFMDAVAEIRTTQGTPPAKAFHDLARGLATPLLQYADQWLAEGGGKGPLKERTRRQYKSDVEEFSTWLGANATIEAVTKPVAGRYITEALLGGGMERKTANRKITAVSSYWRWLNKRTAIEGNPWAGQSLSKGPRKGPENAKRPFTMDEVKTLLAGSAGAELTDAIRVAGLSGMRIEEIYRLRVSDCAGGWFNVTQAKTRAGVRRVPIHSALSEVVTRRTQRASGTAYLFPEGGPLKPGRERSMAVSKRFGRYRKRVGVDERADGQRQSNVDFHSWRRWFVTQAREAGFDRAVVAAIVGHEAGNITDDVYSGGPSEERKRACVESVKLPRLPRA